MGTSAGPDPGPAVMDRVPSEGGRYKACPRRMAVVKNTHVHRLPPKCPLAPGTCPTKTGVTCLTTKVQNGLALKAKHLDSAGEARTAQQELHNLSTAAWGHVVWREPSASHTSYPSDSPQTGTCFYYFHTGETLQLNTPPHSEAAAQRPLSRQRGAVPVRELPAHAAAVRTATFLC